MAISGALLLEATLSPHLFSEFNGPNCTAFGKDRAIVVA